MKKLIPAILSILIPFNAEAQQVHGYIPLMKCGDTEELQSFIDKTYQEKRVFAGVPSDTHLSQIFLNEDTGTFSFVMTDVGTGQSCVIAAGEGGQILKPELAGDKM